MFLLYFYYHLYKNTYGNNVNIFGSVLQENLKAIKKVLLQSVNYFHYKCTCIYLIISPNYAHMHADVQNTHVHFL